MVSLNRYLRVAFALLLLSPFASCVNEGLDECEEDYVRELVFYYDGNGSTDIFSQKISEVYMYVFDDSGTAVDSVMLGPSDLAVRQGANLSLPAGTYKVVCWGNIREYSEIMPEKVKADYRLYQSQWLAGEDIRDFDSLYYGNRIIELYDGGAERDTVYFHSAHIDIEVYVEGYESFFDTRFVPGSLVRVRNAFVGYDFDMTVTGETSEVYPYWTVDTTGEIARAAFRLFRFRDDNDILIDILNSIGDVKYTIVLEQFMRQNGITVDGVDEILIPIRIEFQDAYVHVSVAEWDTENVKPIFR